MCYHTFYHPTFLELHFATVHLQAIQPRARLIPADQELLAARGRDLDQVERVWFQLAGDDRANVDLWRTANATEQAAAYCERDGS